MELLPYPAHGSCWGVCVATKTCLCPKHWLLLIHIFLFSHTSSMPLMVSPVDTVMLWVWLHVLLDDMSCFLGNFFGKCDEKHLQKLSNIISRNEKTNESFQFLNIHSSSVAWFFSWAWMELQPISAAHSIDLSRTESFRLTWLVAAEAASSQCSVIGSQSESWLDTFCWACWTILSYF